MHVDSESERFNECEYPQWSITLSMNLLIAFSTYCHYKHFQEIEILHNELNNLRSNFVLIRNLLDNSVSCHVIILTFLG